jgi:steroid delta-isomerase-like uncharacterized protein
MPTEENKAVVRRWFEAFNARDLAAEAAARSPDFVAHVSGLPGPLDSAGWPQFIATFLTGFPDFRLAVEEALGEGDRVAVRWTFHGTHNGEFLGIPPTGKPVAIAAMEVNRVVGGRVAEHWVVLDQLGMLQQLGVAPTPGQGG